MSPRIGSYNAFWPHYLREHAKAGTRYIHFLGTSLALLSLLAAPLTGTWAFLALAPVAGYGPAWIAHLWVEKNRPVTFRYPLWSLCSDFRMYFAWIAGTLPRELRDAELRER